MGLAQLFANDSNLASTSFYCTWASASEGFLGRVAPSAPVLPVLLAKASTSRGVKAAFDGASCTGSFNALSHRLLV